MDRSNRQETGAAKLMHDGLVRWRQGAIGILLIVLLLSDVFFHRHGETPWETLTTFFVLFGVFSGVFFILSTNVLGQFIKRDEDYYDT